MILKCIKCHNPISSYPCKFCEQPGELTASDCPRKKGLTCVHTGRMCHKGIDYINCEILRKEG